MKGKALVESRNLYATLGALFIVAAFAFGLIVTDSVTSENTPLITIVTGFFGLFITQVLGKQQTLNRIEAVHGKVDRVLNSEMDAKIEAAVHKVLTAHEEAAE